MTGILAGRKTGRMRGELETPSTHNQDKIEERSKWWLVSKSCAQKKHTTEFGEVNRGVLSTHKTSYSVAF